MKRVPLSKRLRRKDLSEPFILTANGRKKALVLPYKDYIKVRVLLAQAFNDSLERWEIPSWEKHEKQNTKAIQ